jgi:hypothetical protein
MAEFKTAHGQHILPLEVKVAEELTVGDLVTYTAGTNTIAKASGLDTATHIVALSDETIGGNYVHTDDKVYNPSYKVAASATTAKRVGLYPIFDKGDVIV